MSIYHWKLGDIALARICKKIYAKVKVVKDDQGLFYDDKVLAISPNDDGSLNTKEQLCYFVEISRTGEKLWVPYTSLHLAGRSRPFYGTEKVPTPEKLPKSSASNTRKKRKVKEEHVLPLQVKPIKLQEPDLNATYDTRNTPVRQGKYDNAFRDFIRRSKDMLFDEFYVSLKKNKEAYHDKENYLSTNASTEDKFEVVVKDIVSEKEIDHYLHQCWRYNFLKRQLPATEESALCSPEKQPITVHLPFCLVCGKEQKLRECQTCPASFHVNCKREWLISIFHRKKVPQMFQKKTTFVEKILSSTRVVSVCASAKEAAGMDQCPSCVWGPKVGYNDVVWHKLSSCPWWPARVLAPGAVPACLMASSHLPTQWPLRYYGTKNHAWGDASRMCLFLPRHMEALSSRPPDVQSACHDACDDYIVVYLT